MKINLKSFPYAQTADQMEAWVRKFKRELQEYIDFVDGLRTHGKPKEVLIKYEVYKQILGAEASP